MKHLQHLRSYIIANLPKITPDKFFLSVDNGQYDDGQMHYKVKMLMIDYRADPFFVLILVNRWLRQTGRLIQPSVVPVIGFDCELVDSETFDLEVTIPLQDKIVDDGAEGYEICVTPIWDEGLGRFVKPGCGDE